MIELIVDIAEGLFLFIALFGLPLATGLLDSTPTEKHTLK